MSSAIEVLGALAQPTRLGAFRLLVQHEPAGLPAGDVARRLELPQNTVSTHLSMLQRAGLVRSEKAGRAVVYHAKISRMREVMVFLADDCCGGRPDLCLPLIDDFSNISAAEACCD